MRPGSIDAWAIHPGSEEETHHWIEQQFHSTGALIDVGAFIGTFALRHRKQFSKIIAIEASRANFEQLVHNVEINGAVSQVTVIQAAASSKAGEVALYLSSEDTHSTIGAGAMELVQAVTLDAVWRAAGMPKVDLIKIDVEGAEIAVLEGAVGLLAAGCVVLAEANTKQALQALSICMEAQAYGMPKQLDDRNYVFEPVGAQGN